MIYSVKGFHQVDTKTILITLIQPKKRRRKEERNYRM